MSKHKDQYTEGRNPSRRMCVSQRYPSGKQNCHTYGGRYGYRKEERHMRVATLAEERAARTPEEQIRVLDQRLGVGCGAVRERARLNKLIK